MVTRSLVLTACAAFFLGCGTILGIQSTECARCGTQATGGSSIAHGGLGGKPDGMESGGAPSGGTSTGGAKSSGGGANGGSISTGGSVGSGGSPHVSSMIEVTGTGGVATYWIDSTEVTNSAYADFLASHSTPSGSVARCAGNSSYVPTSNWPNTSHPNRPVNFVDWCDAHDYCTSIGRRLCGAIGGGAADRSVVATLGTTSGQWMRACSGPSGNPYPYGAALITPNCNTDSAGLVDVASLDTCQGSVGGLYDMVGNVYEWVDSCDDGATTCVALGGAYATTTAHTCDLVLDKNPSSTTAGTGFRCCSDSAP